MVEIPKNQLFPCLLGKPDEEIMEFTELTKEQLEKLKKKLEED